jgi:hypothetical protein
VFSELFSLLGFLSLLFWTLDEVLSLSLPSMFSWVSWLNLETSGLSYTLTFLVEDDDISWCF